MQFAALTFDLGGGLAGQNVLNLFGSAAGGHGGHGGWSATGGASGFQSAETSITTQPGADPFTSIGNSFGLPAGQSPDGRNGGGGRSGTADFTGITVTGENVATAISSVAQGGSGGMGGGAGRLAPSAPWARPVAAAATGATAAAVPQRFRR